MIAPFLAELAARYKADGVKVGSYPSFGGGVTVSLIGVNEELIKDISIEVRLPSWTVWSIACVPKYSRITVVIHFSQVVKELDGTVIAEDIDDAV